MGTNEMTEVKKLGESSATAKVVSKYLATRERLSHESDVNRYKTYLKNSGEKIDDKEFDIYWKTAERIGLGSLDKKGRFRWHYNLKTVGQIAMGENPDEGLQKLVAKKVQQVQKRPRGRPATSSVISNKVGYMFRNSLIFFPLDINQAEADNLAQFVKNIPHYKGV